MAVTKILVKVKTLEVSAGGSTDSLYLGVIAKVGGREFPLRYQKQGLNIGANQLLEFGINTPDLPANKQIFSSAAGGSNHIDAYSLNKVERVYLRKEPANGGADRDDTLGIEYVAAFITESDGTVVDWSNRNRPDGSGPSPFWLGNEFGQIVYLVPEVVS